MSVAVSSWVWKHSKTGGGDRLLLLAIADCADDDGDNAWPSVATLASKTQTSDRTVQRGIERLEREGCLEVHRGAGRGGTHRYRVLMDARAAGQDEPAPPVDNAARSGEDPAQGVSDCHPVRLTEGVTKAADQRRKRTRSRGGMPSNSAITVTGSGKAKSSIRSIWPRACTWSSRSWAKV